MGLLLVRAMECESGLSWGAMREELDELMVTRLRSKDGLLEMVTDLTDSQRKILKKLDIKPPRRVRKVSPPPSDS